MQSFSDMVGNITTLFEQGVDDIAIGKLTISPKVSRKGVELYKDKLKAGVDLSPLIVIKHPREERYVVLDGNHKAHAHREMGSLEIKCVVYQDHIGLLYFLTEQGLLQPPAFVTEYVRMPFKKLTNGFYNILMSKTT